MKSLNLLTAPLSLLAALGLVTVFGLAGCDVDTEEGNVELPEYEKVDDGELDMPEVDVDGPEIETGTKTIEVPTVDVDAPESDGGNVEE